MNEIIIAGTVVEKPKYSHTVASENFYEFQISTQRLSDTSDVIVCLIPETYVKYIDYTDKVEVLGEIRTRNFDGKLEIRVFVKEVTDYVADRNMVLIDGFICKEPIYRETPSGRQITDVILACERKRGHSSDYIPSLAWGRNAIRVAELPVGKEIRGKGRLQSRMYMRMIDDAPL